ncbi:hypothetical protein NDU88_007695 [Pleurodeles waltl]|uniref:Uncharacterized protein n=1 Tax=Pleurodeles waltl TaxID=8319 RepID=A0AAV7P2W4_PLEWA|nr:hypothetical protein NDU88_007695 [Pleurodeles waltl]
MLARTDLGQASQSQHEERRTRHGERDRLQYRPRNTRPSEWWGEVRRSAREEGWAQWETHERACGGTEEPVGPRYDPSFREKRSKRNWKAQVGGQRNRPEGREENTENRRCTRPDRESLGHATKKERTGAAGAAESPTKARRGWSRVLNRALSPMVDPVWQKQLGEQRSE